MKVLFINVVKSDGVQRGFYPLSFPYLISYCQSKGLDFQAFYSEDLSSLRAVSPDVVAFTCITENYNLCQSYAKKVKKFNSKTKIILGGAHISAVPTSLSSNFDAAIIGEGEQTFLELALNNFTPRVGIDGLFYRSSSGTALTAPRALIKPLDLIPHPARSLYVGLPRRQEYIFTARGCSYRCKFCCSSRFWKEVRLHSAGYVAEELMELRANGARHIQIFDDTFMLSLERVKEIRDLLKGSDLTFSAALRANQVTDEVVQVLKSMRVIRVGMGLESNSARVLDWLEKGNTPEINQRAVNTLKRGGLAFSASFIYGTPVETKEDLRETFRFIKRNSIEYDMYKLMRFPGTPLYNGSTKWDSCRVALRGKGLVHRGKVLAKRVLRW